MGGGDRSAGIFIGVNAIDYSGYPDCRPEYIAAFEKLANLATKAGVEGASLRVHAPLISLSKAEIIRRGLELGVDFSLTHSCYDPDSNGIACGAMRFLPAQTRGFSRGGRARSDSLRWQVKRFFDLLVSNATRTARRDRRSFWW